MKSGAAAFFLKSAGNEELLAGIASAMNGS
jgi:hypothetical protein